jgi:transketolase
VSEALAAAEKLEMSGVKARVLNIHTVKPIDAEAIIQAAAETGALVTAENHSIIGGLGSAVAEVLAEERPTPLVRVGVGDRFGEVGKLEYLMRTFGITAADIESAARKAIQRKLQWRR